MESLSSILKTNEIIPMKIEEKSLIASIPKCEYCNKDKIEKIFSGYKGNIIKTWEYQCSCVEKINKKKELRKRGKLLIDKIYKIKNNSDIGIRFRYKTFTNFDKELNSKAYNECLGYVRNLEKNLEIGRGLFITGSVGSGKTHLIAGMIDWIARMTKRKNQIWIIFTTSVDMLAKIKYSFDRKYNESETNEELMERFEDCDILIIDDLGTEKTTDWAHELLYKIIDYRYSNLKPLIITTNLTDQELKEKLSERLVSRIYEMCKGIRLTGKDYRLEKLK